MPSDISPSETVSGGAMRKTLPMLGILTMLVLRPRRIASSPIRLPSSKAGSLLFPRAHDLEADEQAPAAHVADAVIALLQSNELLLQELARRRRALSTSCSLSTTSRTAKPTAAGSGSDTCVV